VSRPKKLAHAEYAASYSTGSYAGGGRAKTSGGTGILQLFVFGIVQQGIGSIVEPVVEPGVGKSGLEHTGPK
jgi:hypothetical protein